MESNDVKDTDGHHHYCTDGTQYHFHHREEPRTVPILEKFWEFGVDLVFVFRVLLFLVFYIVYPAGIFSCEQCCANDLQVVLIDLAEKRMKRKLELVSRKAVVPEEPEKQESNKDDNAAAVDPKQYEGVNYILNNSNFDHC